MDSEEPLPQAAGKIHHQLTEIRGKIEGSFTSLVAVVNAAARPLPNATGDGTEVAETDDAVSEYIKSALGDLGRFGINDVATLLEATKNKATGELTDDKTYLLEGLINIASSLPPTSKFAGSLTETLLSQLYNDMKHPPQSYLAGEYQYRKADGSHNSLLFPQVGAAKTPYAITAKPLTMQKGALPEPGVVFDSIMSRKHHDKHPNKISSMLFYFASILIHDLFRTDHQDYRISNTSSYLDLSPLYGSVWEEQKLMRTMKDGKIKPDCFSEKRLLTFPPGVGCMLIMFNRFHNHVVEQLALINEGGRFDKPGKDSYGPRGKTWEQYDEDLFQTGRLITCGLYINIILIDYVRTILNLNRTDSNWQLNPRANLKNGLPVAAGNQVSAEFNLVYRWHSATSDRDEKWTEELWKKLFPGKDPHDISEADFIATVTQLEKTMDEDPSKRPFAGLNRTDSGYADADLVRILVEGVEDCANAYGAQRVPPVMRVIEILGIQQARVWNVTTLNEFRKYFGLTPHTSFDSINSDPYVAEQLKRLYDEPDLVELYPGLVAEEPKKAGPGAGLTPSYTISRAVLSDAVALVRGDRFYTVDYHPKKLTNWGYNEVQYDTDIDNGCMFYKLFLRAFPNSFAPNSVYVHYPLTIPSEMEKILNDLNKAHMYDFKRPEPTVQPVMTLSYAAAESILHNPKNFKVTWGKAMEFLMGCPARDFMLAGDGSSNADSRKLMSTALYDVEKWEAEIKTYYRKTTQKLLKERAYQIAGVNQVDIVRDIGNIAHVHFAAEMFSLPLKTAEIPLGILTEHELYLILAAVFIVVFFDLDPAASFPVHQKARAAVQQLGKLMELRVGEIATGGVFSRLVHALTPHTSSLKDYGDELYRRLLRSGTSAHQLVWGHVLGTVGGMVPNQGQLFAQTIEYYLTEGRDHLPEMRRLALLDTAEADETLKHYLLEGARLNGETAVFRDVAEDATVDDGGRQVKLKSGDRVLVNLRAASHDPAKFPDPDKVDLTRPVEAYIHLGAGPHQCLGLPMTTIALTALLKEVVKLENIRPVQGPQGELKKIMKRFGPDDNLPESSHFHIYLTEKHEMLFPFPCSLKVNWDGDLPE